MAFLSEIVGNLGGPATATTPGSVTNQAYSAEQTLGAATWSATVAPSGTTTKQYVWSQTGKNVTIYWVIKCSVAGTLVSGVSFPLPSDVPTPWTFSNQVSDGWAYLGSGGVFPGVTSLANTGTTSGIYKEAGGNFSLKTSSGTVNVSATYAMGIVSYLTA